MKYFFSFLLITALFFIKLSAQTNHFIYLQTENKQPFYIKLDTKVYSSTSSGYLIVPRLKEGNYVLKFGFPRNQGAEQTINCKLEKDAGFIIKNFTGKGWGLFNLQSYTIIMASGGEAQNNIPAHEIKNDEFSRMLADVVNDSTLKQKDIVIKEEVKTTREIAAGEVGLGSVPATVASADSLPFILKSVIVKTLQVESAGGIEMVYTDEYNSNKDTIRIFMPVVNSNKEIDKQTEERKDSTNKNTTIKPPLDILKNVLPESLPSASSTVKTKSDSTRSNTNRIVKTDVVDTLNLKTRQDKLELLPAKSGMINSNCATYANNEDFLRLRKKMTVETNDEDMVKVAKKFFKSKCFSTDYIKKLSTIFIKDEGKYIFYDAAYAHVSDSDTFYTLENQLTDQYYINRFRAMVRK